MDHHPPLSTRLLLALAMVGLLVVRTPLSAQPLDPYPAIVEHYARGDIKDAVVELAEWAKGHVGAIEPSIQRLATSQLRAAAMLHTDLAGALVMIGEKSQVDTQLRFANRIIDRLLSQNHDDSAAQTFGGYWYAFASSIYVSQGLLNQARAYADNGLHRFPRSSVLLVARGVVAEMIARQAEEAPRIAVDGWSRGAAARRHEQLLTAASVNFELAIELDKASAVAYLHRGWILQQLGDQRATRELNLALANASDDSVRYLAHLILGAAAESRKDLDAAALEYEAARALGAAQTACVALSHVEAQRGHAGRAREIVDEFSRQSEHAEDPWWNLRIGGFDSTALAWLRAEARQP